MFSIAPRTLVAAACALAIAAPFTRAEIAQPTLKWESGGCYSSWCETGWYSSPAAADIDGDGVVEIVAGMYSLFILDGRDGSTKRQISTPGSRIWPGVALADIDNNGTTEIVIAQGAGYLSAFDAEGEQLDGFPVRPATSELRSLALGDIDGDGTLEIAAGLAAGANVNTWIYEHDGSVRAGWPQRTGEGYSWGVYNDNIALGDLTGSGAWEIVTPSDVHYICAYDYAGNPLGVNAAYPDASSEHDVWGEIPFYVNPAWELQGWGPCDGDYTPRTNFADGPAAIVDIDNDGAMEVVAVSYTYNCSDSSYAFLYAAPWIVNADRSRYSKNGNDWSTPPVDTGAPLSTDYNEIETAQPNAAFGDLDDDGKLEIVFSSFDGQVHAFWLDGTEHGSWPFSVYTGSGALRFAGEPLIADLDNDHIAEVIFCSWTEKGSGETGQVFILDADGNLLYEANLPDAYGASPADWNGAMAAPTLANIDDDADLELIALTAHSGVAAYDLPGSSNARIFWGTGRGSHLRNGQPAQPFFPNAVRTDWLDCR